MEQLLLGEQDPGGDQVGWGGEERQTQRWRGDNETVMEMEM